MVPAPLADMSAREHVSGERGTRPSPGWAIADAVGHCVLVFAFVPALATVPGWLLREGSLAPNLHDPLVLAFLPVRGIVALLNAFFIGAAQGVIAGICAGIALVAWRAARGATASTAEALLRGAAAGAAGATVMVAGVVAWQADRIGAPPFAAVAFEVVSGIVCGVLAAPGASRLLAAADG